MARNQPTAALAAAIVIALTVVGCGGNGMTTPESGTGPSADMAPSFAAMSGAAQTWTDEGAVSLSIPAASGGDGTLSYMAAGLPPGVSFDPATRMLSGTPQEIGSGTITITVTDTDADGNHDTDTYTIAWVVRPASLTVGSGAHRSGATPQYADAAGRTLASLLADDTNTVPTLSAAVTRDHDQSTSTVSSTGWRIESIASDGAGGYRVTYTDGNEVNPIHFTAANFVEGDGFNASDEDGNYYWFGLWDAGYRFFDTGTAGGLHGDRFWFVFGARTPESALPTGSASYSGQFRADTWSASSASHEQRQRLYGDMRIVANFDIGTLMGDISGIQGTEPGAPGSSRSAWATSSFTITDGRMVDGQFTATLTGHDSDASVSLTQSVSGYVGSLLGEFYGPDADEMGAVIAATRDAADDAHDRALLGYVGATRVAGEGTDTAPFSTGVDRHDYSTSPRIVSQDADNRVTAVAFDGDRGYEITYLVDGESRSVRFGADDLGGIRAGAYDRRDGNDFHYYNPFDKNRYVTRGYWVYGRYAADESESLEFGTAGLVVHGLRTAPESMPNSGQATYSGEVYADSWSPAPSNPSVRFAPSYNGDLSLAADFGAGTIAGRIDNLRRQPTGADPYVAIPGQFDIGNGAIEGNGLTGELSGLGYSGTVNGGFFGPAANEIGGILEATHSNGEMLHGNFVGHRE